ncbi:MAG: bacteriocin [Candidatus Nanopelagicales bacterium]|jgi:bacteriocin-like protein
MAEQGNAPQDPQDESLTDEELSQVSGGLGEASEPLVGEAI